ncbi:uncharacterized protein LOC115707376 [Cannabis sativa]|uniref:uncharacterized protein LOC115707376 n=1 Tax=Cannabis sativa TaxID=3483 RepID=UPI0029CA4561|nr:uncharacterized protein LOC115707376 [Cannabis sativa]XP_030491188.2 uncharacterized protein LOC115707376 [Cannabis sativa]XP_060970336.1 uncharacterized protein LOC115707376 [Cannabis sativa]
MLQPEEILNQKSRKKKTQNRKAPMLAANAGQDVQGSMPMKTAQKAPKRNVMNAVSPLVHQSDRSNSDSMPDSSTSGNEYRALRRKYLLLEEESFTLGGDLRTIEEEVNTLENEKFALLDKLVVLEGLVDPSELKSQGKL